MGEFTGTAWLKFLKAVAGNLVIQIEDQSQLICFCSRQMVPLISVISVPVWTTTHRFDIAYETFLIADISFPFLTGVAQGPVLFKYDITVTSLFLTSGKYFRFGLLVGE